MAYQEFYCDPVNGSNLNAGSDSGSPSMTDTAGTGSWVSTTQTYTSVATNGAVAAGQWIAFFKAAATTPTTIARIISVTGGGGVPWVIVTSNTSYMGTQPSSQTTAANFKAIVGGAWLGTTLNTWPIVAAGPTVLATDASGNLPRINLQNSAGYNLAASATLGSRVTLQGMTSTPGDLGKAAITSTTTSSLAALSIGPGAIRDVTITSNQTSGTATASLLVVGQGAIAERVVAFGAYSSGMSLNGFAEEVEVYGCNTSNTASGAGVKLSQNCVMKRCTIHHNTGSNTSGVFLASATFPANAFIDCIFDANTYGFSTVPIANNSIPTFSGCIFSNSVNSGLFWNNTGSFTGGGFYCDNCVFSGNGTYDVQAVNADGFCNYRLVNCATYNTGSGFTTGLANALLITGTIALSSDPFVADATGNFAPNTTVGGGAALAGAGRGAFTQTYSGYTTPTTSYPTVGAATNNPSGGGGSTTTGGTWRSPAGRARTR